MMNINEKLIVNGEEVYEIDEECIKKRGGRQIKIF